jgi:hypothetical protein
MTVDYLQASDIVIHPDEEFDDMDGIPFYLSDVWQDIVEHSDGTWVNDILSVKYISKQIELRPLNRTYFMYKNRVIYEVTMDLKEGIDYAIN